MNKRSWVTLTVSEVTAKQIKYLIDHWGESRSQVIRRCVERMFQEEKNRGEKTSEKGGEEKIEVQGVKV